MDCLRVKVHAVILAADTAVSSGVRGTKLQLLTDGGNIDAQVDSFLYYAKFRGLGIAVAFEPDGHHDGITAMKFMPALIRWLGPQLEPYAPGRLEAPCGPPR